MTPLDTGPWCSECGIHRVNTPTQRCPVCTDERPTQPPRLPGRLIDYLRGPL